MKAISLRSKGVSLLLETQEQSLKENLAIKRSDIVIVMVGSQTHRARGVLKEVEMAQAANKHIVQVIGYKDGDYTPVHGAGRSYCQIWCLGFHQAAF